MAGLHSPTSLLFAASLAVVILIILIARFKVPAFLALAIASVFLGLCSGMEGLRMIQAFQEGVGAMLSSIAMVVGLGMILGKLLAQSGGAEVIARTLIQALGPARLPWTLMLIGFLVGIPVFFTVGVVLLVPVLAAILKETRQPLLGLGLPLLAGLSVVHGLVPPHPGPLAAIGIAKADLGKTIFYSLLVGLPTAMVSGPCLARWIAPRLSGAGILASGSETDTLKPASLPGFMLTCFTILLPVLLMLGATVADLTLAPQQPLRAALDLIGSPAIAMLVATLFAFYSFGTARGFTRQHLLKSSEACLSPAGSILLVVGAGGGFNRVLLASGVGDAIAEIARSSQFSPLLLGWSVAALMRIATGSATVAVTTAAGIVTPFAKSVPGTSMELLVIATGAGSLILSHVNDGGFWFVREYFGLSVPETFRSWTILETVIALVALAFVLLLNAVVG
jgi:GntP family gluconate:H+ symporter